MMAQIYLKHDDWEQIFPEYKQDIENQSNDIDLNSWLWRDNSETSKLHHQCQGNHYNLREGHLAVGVKGFFFFFLALGKSISENLF